MINEIDYVGKNFFCKILNNKNSTYIETSKIKPILIKIKENINKYLKSNSSKYLNYNEEKIMNQNLCDFIILETEKYSIDYGWTTARHHHYPTTDIPVKNIKSLDNLLNNFVILNIFPLIEEKFNVNRYFLSINDLFIVKYEENKQSNLERHIDGTPFSFNILLNDPSSFEGGGTEIEEGDKKSYIKNTKGGILLHCGFNYHQGINVKKGKRYILVGFIGYMMDYNVNYKVINNDIYENKINFKNHKINLIGQIHQFDKLTKLLEDIPKTKTFLLDKNKSEYDLVEKIVYDLSEHYLKKLNENTTDIYYIEFWWKYEDINLINNKIIHHFHADKDEFLFQTKNELIYPFLSTITYLNDTDYPTIITDKKFHELYKINTNSKRLILSFGKKLKHVCFNGMYYHGVLDLINKETTNNIHIKPRMTLMFNIWKNHKPNNVDFYSNNNYLIDRFTKIEKRFELEQNYNIKSIEMNEDEINELTKNLIQNNYSNKMMCELKKYLNEEKDLIEFRV